MGIFIKLLLLLIVIALAAPFIIEGPDGEPLMTLDDLKDSQGLAKLTDTLGQQVTAPFKDEHDRQAPASSKKTRVYSWKDEQGNVHYSNIPPQQGANIETLQVNPDMNVIKMQKPAGEQVSAIDESSYPAEEKDHGNEPKMFQVYTPEGMTDLKHDAEAARDALQQRSMSAEKH